MKIGIQEHLEKKVVGQELFSQVIVQLNFLTCFHDFIENSIFCIKVDWKEVSIHSTKISRAFKPFFKRNCKIRFQCCTTTKGDLSLHTFFLLAEEKKSFWKKLFFQAFYLQHFAFFPLCHFISRGKMFYIEKYVVPETTSIYCKEGYKSRTSTFILRYF